MNHYRDGWDYNAPIGSIYGPMAKIDQATAGGIIVALTDQTPDQTVEKIRTVGGGGGGGFRYLIGWLGTGSEGGSG